MNLKKHTSKFASKKNHAAVSVTKEAKVRKIIKRYIDNIDVVVRETGYVYHPVCSNDCWASEPSFPDETAVLALMHRSDGPQVLGHITKSAIKRALHKCSLENIFRSLHRPYYFKILKDAKQYLSSDDFSRLLRVAWEADDFYFNGDNDDFSNDDLWELLQSCDQQKFMTSKEWDIFERCLLSSEFLYRGGEDKASFVWASSPVGAIDVEGRFGAEGDYSGYTACVEEEDIFAVIIGYYDGYIVNPDKLQNVQFEWDLREYCDRDELDEEYWEGWDWDDDDDD